MAKTQADHVKTLGAVLGIVVTIGAITAAYFKDQIGLKDKIVSERERVLVDLKELKKEVQLEVSNQIVDLKSDLGSQIIEVKEVTNQLGVAISRIERMQDKIEERLREGTARGKNERTGTP